MFIYKEDYTGMSSKEKLGKLYSWMDTNKKNELVIDNREEVAWLLNLREENYEPLKENDASIYSPVFECRLVVADTIVLYVKKDVDNDIKAYLDDLGIEVIKVGEGKPLSDDSHQSVISEWKMIKNDVEIKNMEKAHYIDGAAMCKFIFWLKHADKRGLTELDVMEKLESIRQTIPSYFMPSFETIAGYNGHGAIIHYEATEESNVPLDNSGVIVIDAGGQYMEGTTDTTRTIALGEVTDKMKTMYTAVLKGHIAVALSVFEPGTKGSELDVHARRCLKELGYDYAHGTGHGVGCLLNVHEHPRRVFHESTVLEKGMITSNEPGVYLEGEFGIRIENVVTVEEREGALGFRNLTLCPYDYDLIDWSMITDEEKKYLDDYQNNLISKMEGVLDKEIIDWLKTDF